MKQRAIRLLDQLNRAADDGDISFVAAVRGFIRDKRECGVTVLVHDDHNALHPYLADTGVPFCLFPIPICFERAQREGARGARFIANPTADIKEIAGEIDYLRDFFDLETTFLQIGHVTIDIPNELEREALLKLIRRSLSQ